MDTNVVSFMSNVENCRKIDPDTPMRSQVLTGRNPDSGYQVHIANDWQKINSNTDYGDVHEDDDFPADYPEGEAEDSAIDQDIKNMLKHHYSKKTIH